MELKLNLADDYIQLEQIEDQTTGGLYLPFEGKEGPVFAKVLAVGPGEPEQWGGRRPMPCVVGDTVLVHRGAGTKYTRGGVTYWFVHGSRKDIIGVEPAKPARTLTEALASARHPDSVDWTAQTR